MEQPDCIGNGRHWGLDLGRWVAALMVVAIHFGGVRAGHSLGDVASQLADAWVRMSVAYFFLLSGFFYRRVRTSGHWWRHVGRLMVMALSATALYVVLRHFLFASHTALDVDTLRRWVVYNWSPGADHLWFLYALTYDLLLMYAAERWHLWRWLQVVAALSLAALLVLNFTPWSQMTRNWLFFGLPFTMLGSSLSEDSSLRRLTDKVGTRQWWWLLAAGLGLVTAEMLVNSWWTSPGQPWRDCYVGTPLCALSLFLLLLRADTGRQPSRCVAWLAASGRNDSAFIYLWHMACGWMLATWLPQESSVASLLVNVPVVFAATLLLSIAVRKMKG